MHLGLFGRAVAAVLLMELAGRNGFLSWVNTDSAYRGLLLILAGVLLLLYALLLLKFKKYIVFVIKKWYILLNVLIPGSIIVLFFVLVDILMYESISHRSKISISLMVILVIILLIALFFFAANGIKSEAQKQKNAELLKLIKTEKDAYETLYNSRQEVIRFKHDIINRMLGLKYLLNLDMNQQAGLELENVIGDVSGEKRNFIKSRHLWDLIIDSRMESLEERDIYIEKDIYPGNYQGISETDLALIIGNLFDNAVEAQDKVPGELRYILFCMKENWGCIYIEMRNSAKTEPDFIPVETTKEDKIFHGWGLKSVQEIVKKYDGTMIIDVLNCQFVVKILLYIK